ncbi:hypothetical protein L0337_05675 [candidate division KSB1 bacterium]|nr:hypothetical protein [candidate division KSB1 bacterium]
MRQNKTKRILTAFVGTTLLACGGIFAEAYTQDNANNKSQLTVPWDEFKKLLQLREDEIVLSLETYEKLLAQTGTSATPQPTLQGGNVVLTRAEFKNLVDQMKPPTAAGTQPPFDYLITKAVYSGRMQKNNTAFSGIFNVHVLKKEIYLKIPILPQSIALQDVKVDGEQALVVSENGYHHVILSKPGENVVTAAFSQKSSLEKGPQKLDLVIQQTPITLLNLAIPLQDIDVEIPQAQQVLTSAGNGATEVSAIIAPGQAINVHWRKKAAVIEKLSPKLYSEVHHLVAIEDDALKINSDILYNILHSEVDQVRLAIPEGMNVLAVTGEAVGEWQEIDQNGQRLLLVPFTYGRKGGATINIAAETALSENGATTAFSGMQVLDTVRENGYIGIALNTSAEVNVAGSEGLERVAAEKLPQQLYNKSAKPLILGFKYLKHPYDLALDVKKHEKIAVPMATIVSANVVTLFTEDGKVVHRLVYQVRNSAKQFLAMQLPEKAQVWSVFVGNEPVESSLDAQGKLLVPLIRSRSGSNQLDTFPVEVLYCMAEKSFSPASQRRSRLPAADLLVSQLIWSVYLPNDYSYLYFTSSLEKEEMIRGINFFSGAPRRYDERAMKEFADKDGKRDIAESNEQLKKAYRGDEFRSQFRNQPMPEEQMSSQLDAELQFGQRLENLRQSQAQSGPPGMNKAGAGVLPIQIQVPTSGQVYRFAKTIITDDDPLEIGVVYTRLWIVNLVKWLVFVSVLWILYRQRETLSRFWNRSKDKLAPLAGFYKRHAPAIRQAAQSLITPFVLLGLFIVWWFISRPLALMIFFLLWVSVVYQFFHHRRRKVQVPESEK